MYGLEYIQKVNDEKTQEAKRQELQPLIAQYDKDQNILKCPFLSNYLPEGFKIVNTYFVDNSGFGSEGEGALTVRQFLGKVKKGFGYAVKEAGQFQVYINEYKEV